MLTVTRDPIIQFFYLQNYFFIFLKIIWTLKLFSPILTLQCFIVFQIWYFLNFNPHPLNIKIPFDHFLLLNSIMKFGFNDS